MNLRGIKLKSKTLNIILAFATVAVIGIGVYLWFVWQKAEARKQEVVGAVANLLVINQNLNQNLNSLQDSLSSLQNDYQDLVSEKDQFNQEINQLDTETNLLRSQKYYLADVLDWYNRKYLDPRPPIYCLNVGVPCPSSSGAGDIGYMVNTYAEATGNPIPQTCEFAPADRYEKWASLQSRMYEITPEKMGWAPFNSVFTNILFGPDHEPEAPGYVGSLGYEIRYPLVIGSWPFQEIHTTVNVYTVEQNLKLKESAVQTVELDCGVQAQIFLFKDGPATKQIVFAFGTVNADVKLKNFHKDVSEAIPILMQAANVIIHDFTLGW